MSKARQGRSPEVVTMGEILIDFMAQPSGHALEEADNFVRKAGGAPANVAVGLVRLGRPSAFVGMVGDDAFGTFLRNTLEEEAVDTRSLVTCDVQPTTLAFVSMDERGVPSFAFYRHPGADLSLIPDDVDLSVFEQARVFHFGSLSLVAPPAYDATLHCLETAREKGAFVTYDPNFRPALWSDRDKARERMREPLGHVDLLKVSDEELTLLSGEEDLEAGCAALAKAGPSHIVVTRGDRGIFGWNHGTTVEIPVIKVDVVDTTGCGDSSMAGLITHLLEENVMLESGAAIPQDAFEAALRFANQCAAYTATRLGAIPSLPHRSDIDA